MAGFVWIEPRETELHVHAIAARDSVPSAGPEDRIRTFSGLSSPISVETRSYRRLATYPLPPRNDSIADRGVSATSLVPVVRFTVAVLRMSMCSVSSPGHGSLVRRSRSPLQRAAHCSP